MTRRDLKSAGSILLLAAALTAAPLIAVAAPEGMQTYVNERYGYSVSYPSGVFRAQPVSESGDGRVFKSVRYGAEFRVWANYAAQSMSPGEIAAIAEGDCLDKHASYRVVRANLVAISCETKDGILYEKQLIHGGLVTAFSMTYPATQRRYWEPVVSEISGSLRAASSH
jgi:hypothetical protein